jgi:dynein heavy chain
MSVKDFICTQLGSEYVDMPPLDLGGVFADSGPSIPILFVLGPGGDPSNALQRFARSRAMGSRLCMLSLGRGFGQSASDAVRRAMKAGDWVFLQNCHLAASWMPALEGIVMAMQQAVNSRDPSLNVGFRLFLSATPDSCLPVNVLQIAVKASVEPPPGVRSTLLNTFCSVVGPPKHISSAKFSSSGGNTTGLR